LRGHTFSQRAQEDVHSTLDQNRARPLTLRAIAQSFEIGTTGGAQRAEEIFTISSSQLLAETIILSGVSASVKQADQQHPTAQRAAHFLAAEPHTSTKGAGQLAHVPCIDFS